MHFHPRHLQVLHKPEVDESRSSSELGARVVTDMSWRVTFLIMLILQTRAESEVK